MSNLEKSEYVWPPRGWLQLSKIKKLSGQVIVKDPVFAKVSGLLYKIEPTPVFSKENKNKFAYHFYIEGWEYDINNTSFEYPILSFVVKERVSDLQNRFLLSEIRSNGRPLESTQILSQRVLSAALHFIHEIDNGNTPDKQNILLLYKVHPSQEELYSQRKDEEALTNIIKRLFDDADNNNAAE